MISRSTLIGALVVVELGIVGLAARAIAGDGNPLRFPEPSAPMVLPEGAQKQGRLDKTLPVGFTPRVLIDVHDVEVVIETSLQPTVRAVESLKTAGYVSGTIPPIVAQPTTEGMRISAGSSGDVFALFGSITRQLYLTVPPAAHVEILSSGRLDASGLRSKLIAHVEEGAIHVRDHRGDLDVATQSGRIELVDVQGSDIAANTHEGRLYLTRVGADRIDAHSNYGRIYAVDVRAVDGALSTHSGRISASFTRNSDATVAVRTKDGEVTVAGLPAQSKSDDNSYSIVTLGDGQGHFEVSTDEGAINISQGASV